VTARIEVEWDENGAYARNEGWVVHYSDAETGFAGSTRGADVVEGIRVALWVLGSDVEVVRKW
jgi:hypothetical protein